MCVAFAAMMSPTLAEQLELVYSSVCVLRTLSPLQCTITVLPVIALGVSVRPALTVSHD